MRGCLRSGCGFLAALEALPAKYRSSLRRLKGNRRFLATIRADGSRFHLWIVRVHRQPEGLGAFALASFTALGFVLELFIVEEKLLSRGENEILPAVNALQNPVLEFHPSCPFVAVLSNTVATTECNAAPDAFIRRVQSYVFDRQCEMTTLLVTYHCVMNADCDLNPYDPSPDESPPQLCRKRKRATASSSGPFLYYLILLFASFFTTTLACQSLFYPLLLARFQVVGVTLHFLDDVFLLHLAFETAEGILQRLAFLQSDFSQTLTPPNRSLLDVI